MQLKYMKMTVPRLLLAAAILLAPGMHAQQPSAASASGSVPVLKPGGSVSAPKVLHSVDPKFPLFHRKTGVCALSVIIDTEGKPQNIHVVRSLSPAMDKSAIKAVEQYTFQPSMRDGKPVPVEITIEVNFQLVP